MTPKNKSISIVIPTYKRIESLQRLLKSIEKQSVSPDEVIIVAAGIEESILLGLASKYKLPIVILFSEPSVCKQRNIGIQYASSKYIQLCDDDIEIPENYLEKLSCYLNKNPDVLIVSGEETQLTVQGKWKKIHQEISTLKLLFNYIFGLPFWCDLKSIQNKSVLTKWLIRQYNNKQNSICKSGWPYVSNFSYPIMQTTIYGLGCAMFKATNLKENLYDESLEQFGLGDNYDVALRINSFDKKIHVLRIIPYKHYKAKSNRLETSKQYYLRTKTLSYFICKLPLFNFKNSLFFLWSLIGNNMLFLMRGKFKYFYQNSKVGIYALTTILKKG